MTDRDAAVVPPLHCRGMVPPPGPARPTAPPRSSLRVSALAALVLLGLVACAEGGSDERPDCEVQVQANHRFYGLVTRPRFAAFPTTTEDTITFDGVLALFADSPPCTYELRDRDGAVLSSLEYALDESGRLSLLVPGRTTVVFRGGYGREGDTGHVFLTDRIGDDIGLYWGTRFTESPADLSLYVGAWRLFALHALFAPSGSSADPDLVGVAIGGTVEVAADGDVTGTVSESESGEVAVFSEPGTAGQPSGVQAFANGRVTMELGFDPPNRPNYTRGFDLGGRGSILFGVDPDFAGNDNATGLVAMMRHRDPADFDAAQLTGVYTLGFYTLFLRPDASGSDSAIGTLELTADGNFELLAENNAGNDFRYNGRFTPTADGGLTFEVAGSDETWQGSFDAGYDTVLLVDPFKETRSNGQTELSIGIALRPFAAAGNR